MCHPHSLQPCGCFKAVALLQTFSFYTVLQEEGGQMLTPSPLCQIQMPFVSGLPRAPK